MNINIPRRRRYPMRSSAASPMYGAPSEMVEIHLELGCSVHVFDPESGLYDAANPIVYRGQMISPVLLGVNRPRPLTVATNGDHP